MEGHLATCTGDFTTAAETVALTGEFRNGRPRSAGRRSHFQGRVQTEQLQRAEEQGIASASVKERPKCAHCDMLGHTKDKCYKLVGYPPNYFKNRTSNSMNQVHDTPESSPSVQAPTLTPTQCQQLIFFLTNHMKIETTIDAIATNVIGICMNVAFNNDHHTWIIDTGATSHICCFKELFNSYTTMFNSHVLLSNSTKVKVEGIGNIKINEDIFLHNVLFIPPFRFNLLSLVTLINTNPFQFTMETDSFILQDLETLRRIGTAKQKQGLLVFEFPKHILCSKYMNICNNVSYET